MAAAGITDEAAYQEAESIMMKMGRYFQIQDDYLDCFGTPEQIGKIGRDIEENKCGWLAVQALKLCNEEQVRNRQTVRASVKDLHFVHMV